jgi:hypothetical protein
MVECLGYTRVGKLSPTDGKVDEAKIEVGHIIVTNNKTHLYLIITLG